MSKIIQYRSIFIIPFILISLYSNAQCNRHGDGNEPKYYLHAIAVAEESQSYRRDSTKVYKRFEEIDLCELEALTIAMTHLNRESQLAYVENLESFLRKTSETILFDEDNYHLIFSTGQQQLAAYKKLYKLLVKSKFPTDRLMGKEIKSYFQNAKQKTSLNTSEDIKRGVVLGIVIAGLGSMDKNAKSKRAAMNRGAFMADFFARVAASQTKNSFLQWKTITTELYNLPDPYAIK